MSEERRLATLLMFAQTLERTATDDILDLFDGLMATLALSGETTRRRGRLRSLKDLDQAALVLEQAVRLLLDDAVPDAALRQHVLDRFSQDTLRQAADALQELARSDEDPLVQALSTHYATVRRFLPALLRGVVFEGTPATKPLLDAWRFLQIQETGGRGCPKWAAALRTVVPPRWARRVFPAKGQVHPPAYTLCLVERLVQQNYVRVETLTAANARLVDAQAQLPLAQAWGGGEVASADGMRFVVPVRTIHAGWNRKYFGSERGVTYYNFTSDQFTGFHGIVIPGTLRDSLFIQAGLLKQQTSLDPREIMADTHGYSDVVFGLFSLLGYRFSPRLADLPDQRFWCLEKEADYGPLNALSRHVVNARLIAEHWNDMLRLAGSLKLGKVKATAVMRTLQRAGTLSGLGRAVAEVGRVEKTLYLLAYVQDAAYCRRILVQLNRGEGRHAVARAVFHGKKGELRQRYREGMEDQLGALGLVVNALVLWNTRYLQQALKHQQAVAESPDSGDVARLPPLLYEHINMLGRYDFSLPESIAAGQLRPLRDPTSLEEQLAQLP